MVCAIRHSGMLVMMRMSIGMIRRSGRHWLRTHLHCPARDEDHRGQDLGQGRVEASSHGANIALLRAQENRARKHVARVPHQLRCR